MHPAWLVPSLLAQLYVTLFTLERFLPLRAGICPLAKRVPVNVLITCLAFAAAAVTVRPGVSQMLHFSAQTDFGLLALFDLPRVLEFGVAFLLFDWSFYWWHWANHRVPLLWRFHNAHHIDPDLDVTTAFRFHAAEVGYSALFRVMQVALIGPAAWMYFLYECAFLAGALFHHSNVKLPLKFERELNLVFVTPRMHGIHHSNFHRETDSNYSTVFSWWDRLHRSVRLNVPQRDIETGVPGYPLPEDNHLLHVLSMPFRKQRAYWQRPDGTTMEVRRTLSQAEPKSRMQE